MMTINLRRENLRRENLRNPQKLIRTADWAPV